MANNASFKIVFTQEFHFNNEQIADIEHYVGTLGYVSISDALQHMKGYELSNFKLFLTKAAQEVYTFEDYEGV